MKSAKLVIVLVIVASFILWCRRSMDIGHIARSLPFSGGCRPGIYDVGAIAVLLVLLWGFSRQGSRGRPAGFEGSEPEEDLDDEYDAYEDEDEDDDL